ncbi:trypco2 family protein [Nocardiopsis sp. HUAS JQ3]|uniref:trypco2 family protein n=1 Tax=Nocardiopsis sp. HUAS JQ3 TaxID=3061629 RepID=UPI0023A96D72|nr:trypco2 family protein [Nocardiopsis sp. HUAS JQ3]WDZ91030.1 hypothetical protein PV789_00120 [Nocardiopsis sp. HUAS JQ3]
MPTIGLSQAIDELRRELAAARRRGEGHEIGIEIVEAEVELLLEAHREGAGKAGVRFGVLSLNAEGKAGRRDTHRITLKLALTDADGRKLAIASESGAAWEDRRDLD